MLPSIDQAHLDERAPGSTITNDGSMICVLIPNYALPSGFTHVSSDLLLRLSPGYPDVPPDMWWFDPAVQRVDGQTIIATDSTEGHLGRVWQRWSRHLTPGQWQAGIDTIESYLALVAKELRAAAQTRAA